MSPDFDKMFNRVKTLNTEWSLNWLRCGNDRSGPRSVPRRWPHKTHLIGYGDFYDNAEVSCTTSEGYAVKVYSYNEIPQRDSEARGLSRSYDSTHCGLSVDYEDGTRLFEGSVDFRDKGFWAIQEFLDEVIGKIRERLLAREKEEEHARRARENHLREGFLK